MKPIRTFGVALVLAAFWTAGALAQQATPAVTLKVGDPAPPLLIEKWVKGDPVEKLEKGKIYVVEFWATWCGPCIAAFPHVTELQKKYADKGVTVIGVDIWERGDRSKVPEFVEKQGEKMGYTVAMEQVDAGDPLSGKMAQTWMRAAGRNGIPCSFIIDRETKIAWIGHPMQMDKPLEQIVAGNFDAQAEAQNQERQVAAARQRQAAAAAAAQARQAAATLKVGDPAPPLLIEKWVKGDEVKELEKGKVYVVEFWATWCGPCIAAFPHVTELQKKYADKGVTVIGVDIWERGDRSKVPEFVEKQGERMGYTVAMEQVGEDPMNGKMAQTWMRAAGQNGIPCSFIVGRDGKIAWIGHPMRMDQPLEKAVAAKAEAK